MTISPDSARPSRNPGERLDPPHAEAAACEAPLQDERLAALGARISGIAHELNNPLNTILNFAQLMLLDPRSEGDAEALSIVQREAERAAQIVKELRAVAHQVRDAAGDPAPGGSPQAPRPLKVLVVDEESSIRFAVKRYLERRGHLVEVAGGGEEALSLLRDRAGYDVILADARASGPGGEQLLDRLRAGGDGIDGARVVFMTGDAADAERILAATRAPALLKPVRFQDLARAVESVGAAGAPSV